MDSKICTRCGIDKPLHEFYPDKRARTKTQSACKCCAKAYLARNADYIRQKKREYRQANREQIREKNRGIYWKAPERNRENAAKYREKNHEKVLQQNRERLRKDIEQLRPRYIAYTLRMSQREIPASLMALKKEQLTIRRLARQLRKGIENENIENDT